MFEFVKTVGPLRFFMFLMEILEVVRKEELWPSSVAFVGQVDRRSVVLAGFMCQLDIS